MEVRTFCYWKAILKYISECAENTQAIWNIYFKYLHFKYCSSLLELIAFDIYKIFNIEKIDIYIP